MSASGDSQDGAVSVANPATMQKMGVLEEMIGEYYLEDAGESELEQGVYKGMIEALGDPYSTYYSQEELEDLQNKTQGIYYGIGARVGIDADTQLA